MIFVKLTVFFLFTMCLLISSYIISVQPRPSAKSSNSSVNPPGILFVRYPLTRHLLIYDLCKADCFLSFYNVLIYLLYYYSATKAISWAWKFFYKSSRYSICKISLDSSLVDLYIDLYKADCFVAYNNVTRIFSFIITVQPRPSAGSGNSSVNPPGIVFVRYRLTPHLLIYILIFMKLTVLLLITMSLVSFLLLLQCNQSHQLGLAIRL